MKLWLRLALISLTVLTLTACSARNAPPPLPPPQPQGDGATPAEPSQVAAKADFAYKGKPTLVTATLTDEQLTVLLDNKPVQHLDNPFDENASTKLQAIERPDTSHLLVTLADNRTTYGWVLIPDAKGFRIALALRVDGGISVSGDVVEATHRKYQSNGGYHLVLVRYRYDPETDVYERITD